MPSNIKYPEHLVFGLDIGTRSIVGTVGYKDGSVFKVVAQVSRFHETRAMLDGQIHDIIKVSETIKDIKDDLEHRIGRPLTDVCIAAAGRMLKTVTVRADCEFGTETVMEDEHVQSLNLLGVEKAYDALREETKEEDLKFYCVGYSVIRYYLNDFSITSLLGHKASKAGTELIATFLPEEVIDGLYAAIQKAGLFVANLTLEPIAAINVAIPENYRLLNIALVDVGAGTSDISITKDGSIVAYGMIPFAGDEITEQIAKSYLVDFATAETIKTACLKKKTVSYKDILGIPHKLDTKDIIQNVSETVDMITKNVADKIIGLNGEKSVSAVFVVGGGGKIPSFVEMLAQHLGLPKERVALRGQEVLQNVVYLEEEVKKDSTLVTPIGICLNFYEQKNNFIFIQVNGQRVKLYDNNHMSIADVAVQIGFPNEQLFPQRGKALFYYVGEEKRMVRGEAGESAVVKLNGKRVGISAQVEQNDKIEIESSTVGKDAVLEVRSLPEYKETISFQFNNKTVVCPKFIKANDELVSGYYEIQDGDRLEILNYYTLEQVLAFMDLEVTDEIYINNELADLEDKVYENFSIRYIVNLSSVSNEDNEDEEEIKDSQILEITKEEQKEHEITVMINGEEAVLKGKKAYIFVDILDVYPFDMSAAATSHLRTKVNGKVADFTTSLSDNDNIDMYWEE
ncbi:cell division FtsA domain-containing protein [[Clostridium] polysaccharolyticum]|uniref:Cell division protein FtsA n=1 Tax=[Clostridium] polysaccharolyticum TaxID=29364 RepID=A0A1I0AYW9_9FIRM|nr:cell division FtsA domain-containing protein [[Clostridium] polysaccharolyticum]SES99429.1 cell division protein FtsA [[Clostridium] polysaccharolyticum]